MPLKVLYQLWPFVRPYRWALPVLVTLGLLASLSEGLGIGLLVPLLQVIVQGEAGAEGSGVLVGMLQRYADLFGEESRLVLLGGSIIALIVLKSAILYANSALFAWINGRIGHAIRGGIFRQLLSVGYLFLAKNDSGRLLNTLAGETWRTTAALSTCFTMVVTACTIVVFTVLLLLIAWQVTVGMALGVLAASALVRLVTTRARRLGEAAVAANAALTERMVEAMNGMRIIRAFGQEEREARRFDDVSEHVRGTFFAMDLAHGVVQPFLEVLYAPLFLGALLLAGMAGVDLPILLAFLLMLYRLQPHIKRFDQNRVYLAALSGAVSEVGRLLGDRDKPYVRSGTLPFAGLQRGIAFREATFRYDPDAPGRPALHRVSFEVRKGQVTAIVGASGAGKSTLVNLLCRFYDPDEGDILVDGRPLRDLDLAAWRARIGLAGQDADLMSATVRENIAYGRPGAGQAAIEAAARQAAAHDFIAALPLGYDTLVGQRGLRLSAGQRQRIGLARALVRDPDLLVLDEATNALDGPSQVAIQEALERLSRQVTTIVIAHRLSTIRNADHVVVLSEGRVVEEGHPADLVSTGGPFARLYGVEVSGFRR